MEEEGLGIWNFIHGTGAGCASIFAWEGMRHMLTSGPVMIVIYGGLTVGIMHIVHRHRVHLKRQIGFRASERGLKAQAPSFEDDERTEPNAMPVPEDPRVE